MLEYSDMAKIPSIHKEVEEMCLLDLCLYLVLVMWSSNANISNLPIMFLYETAIMLY